MGRNSCVSMLYGVVAVIRRIIKLPILSSSVITANDINLNRITLKLLYIGIDLHLFRI
jgi:hypothetical protein